MRAMLSFVELDLALATWTEPSTSVHRLATGDAVDDGLSVGDTRLLGHVIPIEPTPNR